MSRFLSLSSNDLTCAPLSQAVMARLDSASVDSYYGPTATCEVRRAPALFHGLYPTHFLMSCTLCDVIVCIASAFVSATLCDTLFNMFVPELLLFTRRLFPVFIRVAVMKFRLRNGVLASASFYQGTDILDHWFRSLFLVEFLMKCKNVSMMFAPLVSHIPVTYV